MLHTVKISLRSYCFEAINYKLNHYIPLFVNSVNIDMQYDSDRNKIAKMVVASIVYQVKEIFKKQADRSLKSNVSLKLNFPQAATLLYLLQQMPVEEKDIVLMVTINEIINQLHQFITNPIHQNFQDGKKMHCNY